jgi:malonate-semialdehyde dehydrogenase (acetylating)/methylmalonate-semialdehyde dehydrogenase
MEEIKFLKYFAGGEWLETTTGAYRDILDPSTGAVIAKVPCCSEAEVGQAVEAAKKAFPAWSHTPVIKRTQVLYDFRALVLKHLDELTYMLCRENGKTWDESKGDILKVVEISEFACGAPHLMKGESLMNTSTGFDTVLYREPVGVFAGIAPFNFPAMIPMGWMMPLCIAMGNTFVLKAASWTPMTSMRLAELLTEAGLPGGVVNIVTCTRKEAEVLLNHPDVKGITFVGSTEIGKHIFSQAAANGKRVQALCEAKNHALVLEDVSVEKTAAAIINASFGCAGERCMALPVVVAQESIADHLVEEIVLRAKALKIGPAYEKQSQLGPVINAGHKKFILDCIDKGIAEGAKLALDGRGAHVEGCENGFYLGACVFDHVKSSMFIAQNEIFGPVLSVIRVKDFEEGLSVMNGSRFANGSVIFTGSGYYAREFTIRTHGGMVGVNVGIPVPIGVFPFAGHKDSFFGDLHALGQDGVKFFTETKCVTTRWFSDADTRHVKTDSWDGTLGR